MNRESFIFYRSFYEAIKVLPREVQGEVYAAIMEYALYGNEPAELKPIAMSVFTLVRPLLDSNIRRYCNGLKGGRKKAGTPPADNSPKEKPARKPRGKADSKPAAKPGATPAAETQTPPAAGKPAKKKAETSAKPPVTTKTDTPPKEKPAPAAPDPDLISLETETARMKADTIWGESVRKLYSLSTPQLSERLDEFVTHCKCERENKPHDSMADAKRHFLAWMRKAFPSEPSTTAKPLKTTANANDRLSKRRSTDSSAKSAEDYAKPFRNPDPAK